MKYLMEDTVIEELERAVCRMESMGTILNSLCGPDRDAPDLTSLADLGSLMSRQAMDALNLLAEKEKAKPVRVDADDRPANHHNKKVPEYELTRIWFVPEIPND